MHRFILLFITFIILKKDISITALLESIIFTTAVFIVNKLCIHKLTTNSNNKFSIYQSIIFIFIMIRDILISSWQISKLVLFKNKLTTITPVIEKVTTKPLTNTKTVIFANAVTLTPGTMSFSLDKHDLYIHALKKNYITEIKNSKLINHIEKI